MKRILFFILLNLITKSYAQQTVTETFGSIFGNVSISVHEAANGFDGDGLTYSGSAEISSLNPSPFGGANVFFSANPGKDLIIDGFKPNSSCVMTVSFWIIKSSEPYTGTEFYVEYSTTGPSGPWEFGPQFNPLPNGPGTIRYYNRSLSVPNNFKSLRFSQNGTLSQYRIDQLVISGTGIGCTFPVKLASFSGKGLNNNISLSWSTSSESTFSHFEIQKSIDAKGFETIGKIQGKGNQSEFSQYDFNDEKPALGNNYYRLKQVDLDGTIEFSKIINVQYKSTEGLFVYPNPTIDYLKFQNLDFKEVQSVKVYNSIGLLVKEIVVISEELDLEGIPLGNYLLVLQMKDHKIITKRFVKE